MSAVKHCECFDPLRLTRWSFPQPYGDVAITVDGRDVLDRCIDYLEGRQGFVTVYRLPVVDVGGGFLTETIFGEVHVERVVPCDGVIVDGPARWQCGLVKGHAGQHHRNGRSENLRRPRESVEVRSAFEAWLDSIRCDGSIGVLEARA